jgi:hypothetical protein
MAKKNRINLINEFAKSQRNNDYIILTTYCFDPFFFDSYLLPKIIRNNYTAEIIVLMDSEQYDNSYERFTSMTGTSYHLVPIRIEKGVFHPKFHLFFSESKHKLSFYVGSNNLTLQGFTGNAELVAKFEYDLGDGLGRSGERGLEFLRFMVDQNIIRDKKVKTILNELLDIPLIKNARINPDTGVHFVHNIYVPIIEQIMAEVIETDFEELFLLAPFFSSNANVIQEILKTKNIGKVTLGTQKGNHNLKDLKAYEDLCKKNGIDFSIKAASLEGKRRLHSKVLEFKGDKNYLLMGSPNMTNYALMNNASRGNLECGIFLSGINSEEIIDNELKIKGIKDIKDFLESRIPIITASKPRSLEVYSVKYQKYRNLLTLTTKPLDEEVEVKIETNSPSNTITETKNLSEGKAEFHISEGIPFEVTLSLNGESVRRRIFYDKNYFFKRISRARVSFKDITDRLFLNASFSPEDLMILLGGLGKSLEQMRQTEGSKGETPLEPGERPPRPERPSVEPSVIRIDPLLRELNKIYDAVVAEKREIAETEEDFQEENGEKTPHRPHYSQYDKSRIIWRIISKTDKIIWTHVLMAKDEEYNEAVINSQALFIHFFLKVFREIHIDEEILEDLHDLMEENLDEATIKDTKLKSRLKLFSHMVVMDYINGFSDPFYSETHIFDIDELTEKKNFETIREFSEKLIENLGQPFLMEEFRVYYAELVKFTLTSSNVSKSIIRLCERLMEEKDEDLFWIIEDIIQKNHFSVDGMIPIIWTMIPKYPRENKGRKSLEKFLDSYST